MIDISKLRDHINYGLPYHGDAKDDTLQALEELAQARQDAESAAEDLAEALKIVEAIEASPAGLLQLDRLAGILTHWVG